MSLFGFVCVRAGIAVTTMIHFLLAAGSGFWAKTGTSRFLPVLEIRNLATSQRETFCDHGILFSKVCACSDVCFVRACSDTVMRHTNDICRELSIQTPTAVGGLVAVIDCGTSELSSFCRFREV